MTSIADGSVIIQTTSEAVPCPPPWWGELVLFAHYLRHQGILARLTEGIHFARRRFGHSEVIDFLVLLFGYAIRNERTLEAFYEALRPWASPFMALIGRDRLPSRSALSWTAVEALRTLFLADLLARELSTEGHTGELLDRCGGSWLVFDVDGTREAARVSCFAQRR
jgi:hypothetical protein